MLAFSSPDEIQNIFTFGIGIVSYSVTEKESTLQQTDTTVAQGTSNSSAQTATTSATSFFMNYEFGQKDKRSYFVKGVVPIMSPDGTGVFLGGIGVNFFYNSLPSSYKLQNAGTALFVQPKYRIYYGGSIGGGNLIYNTKSAKKSDTLIELSVHGAGSYNFDRKWGGMAQLSVGKTFGIASDAFGMVFFLGTTFTGEIL